MKSTKVRTHEDHALLLLPETATVTDETQINAAVPQRPKPFGNLQWRKKTAVSRTNSAFIVANLAIWREPVTRRKKMMPDHVTLSPLAPLPPKRKPPWMMKTTPVLTCLLVSRRLRRNATDASLLSPNP